jgi:hypothetical protein
MKKKKIKLQINKKFGIPKWIPPEKRMKTYEDFGVVEPGDDPSKVIFTRFEIVVPTEKDREELQAAFEYFHDCPNTDTDFVTINQLVHEYKHCDKDKYSNIIVDFGLYYRLKQSSCLHTDIYIVDGIKYCKECLKALEVKSV